MGTAQTDYVEACGRCVVGVVGSGLVAPQGDLGVTKRAGSRTELDTFGRRG